ncbi:MAG TPA: NmrA/HSCARG family protein [Thermoplasmata archaeon]
MAETMTILVAGATGHQGGAVSRSLLKRGHRVRALTRNPTRARPLETLGAQVVQGDLTDFRSVVNALREADGLFVMTTPFERGLDDEVRQGTTALDAAKEVGVGHVVLTSVSGADQNSGIPHYETKARVEEHLHGIGIPGTIVRPVLFMETLLSPRMLPGIQSGTLALPVKPETKVRLVAVKDIGEIVARAFERPEKGTARAWDLAGDSRTMPEAAAFLSKKLERQVKFVQLPEDRALQAMGEGMLKMFHWLDARGPSTEVAALEEHWEYRMTRLETFLNEARLQL